MGKASPRARPGDSDFDGIAGPVVAGLLIKVDLFGTDWRAPGS